MMQFKKIFLIITIAIFICFISSELITSQQILFETSSIGLSECLLDISFVDSQNGWISGWGGSIFHTENGGRQWEKQDSGVKYEWFNGIWFLDELRGWIWGRHGSSVQTTDGGKNWFRKKISNSHFMNIRFVSNLSGW